MVHLHENGIRTAEVNVSDGLLNNRKKTKKKITENRVVGTYAYDRVRVHVLCVYDEPTDTLHAVFRFFALQVMHGFIVINILSTGEPLKLWINSLYCGARRIRSWFLSRAIIIIIIVFGSRSLVMYYPLPNGWPQIDVGNGLFTIRIHTL